MIIAMILAGGVGSRVGADCPKQFVEVLGKPILAYTIEIYQKHSEIDEIEVVCHRDWLEYCNEMVRKYNLSKVKWIVPGGDTFQASVISGVNNLEKAEVAENDYVLIHYGAAPFTSDKIIDDVIRVMKEKDSSITVTPCYQLMGSNDEDGTSKTWVDRDKYVQLACPYGFRFSYLTDIYKRARQQGLLEKTEPHITSLMYALGDVLYQAYGDQTNIKITTKEDVDLFEGYVLKRKKNET
jgi:2-C-methyl-D-erythritol 4-phosphate cytidylyltransferase